MEIVVRRCSDVTRSMASCVGSGSGSDGDSEDGSGSESGVSDTESLKRERAALAIERKFRRHLSSRLREVVVRRINKLEVAVSYVMQSLKSRKQEEVDVAVGLYAIRAVLATAEAKVCGRGCSCVRL